MSITLSVNNTQIIWLLMMNIHFMMNIYYMISMNNSIKCKRGSHDSRQKLFQWESSMTISLYKWIMSE